MTKSTSPAMARASLNSPPASNMRPCNIKESALFKKLTLLPRQEGSLKIPRLKGSARIYEFGYSNLEMVSEDRSFEVISLPSQGVPKSFTGAVGSFTVSSEVKEKEIALGEAITLTLRIAGRGNFNQFGNPEL